MKQPRLVIMLAIFLLFTITTINSADAITARTCSYMINVKYTAVPSTVTRAVCVENKNSIPVGVSFQASPLAVSNIINFQNNGITLAPGEKRFVNFTTTISQQVSYEGIITSTFYVNPADPACLNNIECNFPVAYQTSMLTISHGTECSNGQIKSCTVDSCPGENLCVGGSWGACEKYNPDCSACEENWTCTEWTACIDGRQNRTCTDSNSCGTIINKPIQNRSCGLCTQNSDCPTLDCSSQNGCFEKRLYSCPSLPGVCSGGVCEQQTCPIITSCTRAGTDADSDGHDSQCNDCNDNDANINPAKQETCNNKDDNCNSLVDENIVRGCDLYHEGICAVGTEVCHLGNWFGCPTPTTELCDLKDNNCDGFVDKDLTRQCGPTDVGICEYGQETCETGVWKYCNAVFPEQEIPQNGIDEDCNGEDLNLCTLFSPKSTIYSARKIPLTVNCNKQVSELSYSLNNNGFMRLCTNCIGSNRVNYFSDGNNVLQVRATYNGIPYFYESNFFVDSSRPYITGTEPRGGFSNGVFTVSYNEANLRNVTLYIREVGKSFKNFTKDNCPSGIGQTCQIIIDVSEFDGKEIEYQFELKDIAGSSTGSSIVRLKVDMTLPILAINRPFKPVYNTSSVLFDLGVSEPAIIAYIDHAAEGRERQLCAGCAIYNNSVTLNDGYHNITLIARDSAGNTDTENFTFYVDQTRPIINSVNPISGYTNGQFNIIYSEENPSYVRLYYRQVGAPSYLESQRTDCPHGRSQTCSFIVDISSYDGSSVEYYFKISDVAGNSAESRQYALNVDKTAPVLTVAPLNSIYRLTRILFNLSSSETADLSYIDQYDNKPAEKRLCSACTWYDRLVLLNNGFHNVTFYARDRAGNTDTEHAEFYVDSMPPQISSVSPRGGYATGVFNVEYSEENCKEMIFTIEGSSMIKTKSMPCESGERMRASCGNGGTVPASAYLDISEFEGQIVKFNFTVIDIADQATSKTVSNLLVDTIPPVFEKFSAIQQGRYLYFNITMNEAVKYLKYIDPKSSWQEKSLCANCVSYGNATIQNKYFAPGSHNVTVIAEDAAGNRRYSSNIIFTTT